MKKILFISHDATRTGAPTLLLNLIKLLITYPDKIQITVIIKNGFNFHNLLINDFEKLCPTVVWREMQNDFNIKQSFNLAKRISINRKDKTVKKLLKETDYIISNTLTNGDFISYYKENITKPMFCYAHELEIATMSYTSENDLKTVLEKTSYYFSPSNAITSHLIKNLNINNLKIHPLNYFFSPSMPDLNSKRTNSDTFNVGIVGTLDWRKGSDIFSVIVFALFNKYPTAKINFLWKGANLNSIDYKRIIYELKKINYLEKVQFQYSSSEMNQFYESIDVLLLPSKEDPYPLVVLEAANYKKPTICFDKAGGASEFINNDCGSVIPYLNINLLVEELYSYYLNHSKCQERGNNAFNKYKSRHMNDRIVASQFFNCIANNLTQTKND